MPVGEDLPVEGVAVVADTFIVEDDLGVGGIHDAFSANMPIIHETSLHIQLSMINYTYSE